MLRSLALVLLLATTALAQPTPQAHAPDRRADIAKLGFRALIAATLASWLTAAIAGLLM